MSTSIFNQVLIRAACAVSAATLSVAGIAHADDTYDLTDTKILGLYKLKTADSKSELQEAELIYNNDNILVLAVDRNDYEYELSAPSEDGIIYEGDGEPNCGGEEEVCLFDLKTIIRLQKVKVAGNDFPQVTVEITQSNAWDEEGKDDFTTIYVLDWSKALAHSIPYFVNIKNTEELSKLEQSCRKALEHIEFENGAGYLNENAICPRASTVQLREPFTMALEDYLKYLTTGGRTERVVTELKAAELKTTVFAQARELASRYNPTEAQSSSRADVLDQIEKIEAYALQGDIIYTYRYLRDAVIVIVDLKTKRVSNFSVRVTDRYAD